MNRDIFLSIDASGFGRLFLNVYAFHPGEMEVSIS